MVSNAIAHTFVSGLAVTMDSWTPSLVVPPQYLGWVFIRGASVAIPAMVTRGRMKGRSLLGVVIGYSRQRVQVIPCRRLEPSRRLWIQKMMLSWHRVPRTRC